MVKKTRLITLMMLVVTLLALAFVASAEDGITVDTLRVRTGPSTDETILIRIPPRTEVVVEGRSEIGDWLLIHTEDGTARGWVASRYVALNDGVDLASFPVTSERVTGSQAAPTQPTGVPTVLSGPVVSGSTVSNLNVRKGPGASHDAITRLPIGAVVLIEGRSEAGDWILIHTVDGSARGWVAANYVKLDGGAVVSALPVTSEIVSDTESVLVIPPMPTESSEEMVARLWSTPVLYNMNSSTAYAIFQEGKALGNRRQVFMRVGDSVTATQPFLVGFGNGNYDLGAYSYLQPTVDWYSTVSPRATFPNSFDSSSISAQNGFVSGAVFDPLWADPVLCNEAPLYCEYNLVHPSVAIVLFGPQDMRLLTAEQFQGNMYRMAKDLIDMGVIPLMSTFANHPDFDGGKALMFNTIILNVARDYDLPLINLWVATQGLPDYGINVQDPVHLTQGPTFYAFNGEEKLYGVTLRNLLTLQALDELRRNILIR